MTSATQQNDNLEEGIIAVMGMTGSGKSTFLNLIIGDNQFKVGHNLNSETADIQEFQFPYEDEGGNKRLLCLLDTPGFGDTNKLDSETLGVISTGLLERPKITGIIYFHNINEPRLTHVAYKAKEIFYDICGGDAMKNVILCTSQWDKLIDKAEGERRESQLFGEFWKKMIDDGVRTARHNNTRESTGRILELILGSNPVTPKLVTELEAEGITLGDTSAGRLVADFNRAKAKEIEFSMDELKKSLEAANTRNERLKAARAEDERKWAQREAEILAQLQEARQATTDAMNRAEKLQAERATNEAEVTLEKERKGWEARQKADQATAARLNASLLLRQDEVKNLDAELKRTQKEKEILAKPFNTVEYAKNVGGKMLGKTLGRFVGGVWGYAARIGFGTADVISEFTGGKSSSERKQEVMESIGRSLEEKGLIGAVKDLIFSSGSKGADTRHTTGDGKKERLNDLYTITGPGIRSRVHSRLLLSDPIKRRPPRFRKLVLSPVNPLQ